MSLLYLWAFCGRCTFSFCCSLCLERIGSGCLSSRDKAWGALSIELTGKKENVKGANAKGRQSGIFSLLWQLMWGKKAGGIWVLGLGAIRSCLSLQPIFKFMETQKLVFLVWLLLLLWNRFSLILLPVFLIVMKWYTSFYPLQTS